MCEHYYTATPTDVLMSPPVLSSVFTSAHSGSFVNHILIALSVMRWHFPVLNIATARTRIEAGIGHQNTKCFGWERPTYSRIDLRGPEAVQLSRGNCRGKWSISSLSIILLSSTLFTLLMNMISTFKVRLRPLYTEASIYYCKILILVHLAQDLRLSCLLWSIRAL